MRNRAFPAVLIVLTAAGLAACKQQEPPPPAPAVRVENPLLGVAIAALSPDFVVAAGEAAAIELVPAGEGVAGKVSIVAGEAEVGGINLVAAVKAHKAEIVARSDGDYKGQAEYVTPLGTTFASRGRFSEAGGTVEERVVFMVHPWGDRTLEVIYRYPAGDDTQARLDALMNGIVGELEGLPAPGSGDAAAESATSESATAESEIESTEP